MSFYETRELHNKPALRTHYFSSSYDDLEKAIIKVGEEFGYQLTDYQKERKEFCFDGSGSLVVTVTSFGYSEHAVDLNIDTNIFFDFGAGRRKIANFYNRLAQIVTYKGVSLHP